ncbi:Polymyxin resistance protein PmrG; Ais protein [Salmonella enterica subsp. enterica serovar Baildon str. R6-199]|nr:Polymyxin resistance protein PmrG; Ais protein [Salmonella enterica subsp. enterica serovar Baildon str. R6-199]
MLAFTLRFIKNKRYFAILAGALVIIAGLTSQHAWSGNGLPQINGKALGGAGEAASGRAGGAGEAASGSRVIPPCRAVRSFR